MLKNITVFRLNNQEEGSAQANLSDLESACREATFQPCGATDKLSTGFAPVTGVGHSELVRSYDDARVFKFTVQTKSVPAAALRHELNLRCKEIEKATGKAVKGKQKKEIKEDIERELLPRAFAKTNETFIVVDQEAKQLIVGSTSAKIVDQAIAAIIRLYGQAGQQISPEFFADSAQAVAKMSTWLDPQGAPDEFTVDRNLELKIPGQKTSVRYADHNLELREIQEHISQGKRPTLMSLTYNERLSFTLTQSLAIKGITLLDVEEESTDGADQGDAQAIFDAQAVLLIAELSQMIDSLANALREE